MVESGVPKSGSTLMEEMKILEELQSKSNARKGSISSELWHACAGPLVTLPQPGSLVYYFPQGHSEQVTASTRRMANTHIPSYPNLLSQMMCQVHNVTLHADKETDEIYAQMILQPVNSENDVLPIPDFGLTKSRQPSEFFCKTLTASDTSTHGGFSVPRRAAEKLFPPLDYSMQPPNQELVVKDLHDNTWTFRHIYRGQPKRHLLTTGWSVFVGSKRLKAGDSVLFIRGEKSQLMLGIRRANRQQTLTPSSVLSTDSMHIGVLAAAAHAAANRSQFTVYYNPRACPSEFVVPLDKYHKAACGTQVSVGMRFGMMFETENSNKRRYTGVISGINDFDPLRWSNSKWRNLQVEWDENGCVEMPDRVSLWEIETPDNLFMFPSQSSSSLKRPYLGLIGVESDVLVKTLHEPSNFMQNTHAACHQSLYFSLLQSLVMNGQPLPSLAASECNGTATPKKKETICQGQEKQTCDSSTWHSSKKHSSFTSELVSQSELSHEDVSDGSQSALTAQSRNELLGQTNSIFSSRMEHKITRKHDGKRFLGTTVAIPGQMDQVSQKKFPHSEQLLGEHTAQDLVEKNNDSISVYSENPDGQSFGDKVSSLTTDGGFQHVQSQQCDANLVQAEFLDGLDWMLQHPSSYLSCMQQLKPLDSFNSTKLDDIGNSASVSGIQENEACIEKDQSIYFSPEHSLGHYPPLLAQEFLSCQFTDDLRDMPLQGEQQYSHELKGLADGSRNPADIYSSFDFKDSKVSTLIDPFVSSTSEEETGTIWDASLNLPSNMAYNFNPCQDVQSQNTSGSYTEFSVQEFPNNSRNAARNVDLCDNTLINVCPWKQVPPLRTYTKVQKVGSVGRSIDVTRFRDYKELKSTIASMFGLEGQLDDPRGSGWKLVYMDYENDVLLVGDDPWEEFISCVRCIRILSPSEVQ